MWMIVIASIIILIVIYYFFIKNNQYTTSDDSVSYKSKEFLLSKTEKTVYDAFIRNISKNGLYIKVFPKIRLTDFLWSPKDNRNAYLRINGKFVDFLLVEEHSLNPIAAVFIVNADNKAKMFSMDVIEPALKSTSIGLIKIDSSIVFKQEQLNNFVKDSLEEYYEFKRKFR